MSFFTQHKTMILSAIVGVMVTSSIPTVVWIHNAYADDRYVQKKEVLRMQIQNIDNALFEIDQEISFAPDVQVKAKYVARKEYYNRQKEALKEILMSDDDEE